MIRRMRNIGSSPNGPRPRPPDADYLRCCACALLCCVRVLCSALLRASALLCVGVLVSLGTQAPCCVVARRRSFVQGLSGVPFPACPVLTFLVLGLPRVCFPISRLAPCLRSAFPACRVSAPPRPRLGPKHATKYTRACAPLATPPCLPLACPHSCFPARVHPPSPLTAARLDAQSGRPGQQQGD